MFVQLFVIAFLAAVSAEPIVNDKDAVIEKYPYQASLQYNGQHICGASLISKNYLVTAAHCITNPTSGLSVRVGSSYHSRGGKVHQVIEAIRHENYKRYVYEIIVRQNHDIALLKVEQAIEFSDTIQPIDLYNSVEETVRGRIATVTGWGLARKDGSISPQLQSYTDNLIGILSCNRAYHEYGGVFDGQICTVSPNKGPCQGDYGSPLVINGKLAGIVSWSGGCAVIEWPVLYTEVAYYRGWIEQHAELD